jgi:hypothetical protein
MSEQNKPAIPSDLREKWASGSDVLTTWKRFGFIPPTEVRNDYQFKTNREGSKQ